MNSQSVDNFTFVSKFSCKDDNKALFKSKCDDAVLKVSHATLGYFFNSEISDKCPNLDEIFSVISRIYFDHFRHCKHDFYS